jgi:TFIIF-interacting CTD phosphatase-like protein
MNRKKYNIILDLDETLINTIPSTQNVNDRHIDRIQLNDNLTVYSRNELQYFLTYLFDNYNVSVWSAGTEPYVEFIVNNIILKYDRRVDFVLSRKDCVKSQEMFPNKQCLKNLKYVYNNIDIYNSQYYNECNTVLVDDNISTYHANYTNTILATSFNLDYVYFNDDYLRQLKRLLPQ